MRFGRVAFGQAVTTSVGKMVEGEFGNMAYNAIRVSTFFGDNVRTVLVSRESTCLSPVGFSQSTLVVYRQSLVVEPQNEKLTCRYMY